MNFVSWQTLDVLPSDELDLSTAFLNCWDWDYSLSKHQGWLLCLNCAVLSISATSGAAAAYPVENLIGLRHLRDSLWVPYSCEYRLWTAFERDEEERSVGQHHVWFLKIEKHAKPQTISENSLNGTRSLQHMAAGCASEGRHTPEQAQELPWHLTGAASCSRGEI